MKICAAARGVASGRVRLDAAHPEGASIAHPIARGFPSPGMTFGPFTSIN